MGSGLARSRLWRGRIGQAACGSAVDIAWHEPNSKGDQRNHHAHFLFTTRRFEENGEWAKTKDRALDDIKKGPEEVKAIRLGVADALNNIAARDKLDVYVEHLSYEQRGLDQEATQHLGPMATKMERQGLQTDIGDKNREIQARNEERLRLREEHKVIDIQIAREKLNAQRQEEERQQTAPKRAGGGRPEAVEPKVEPDPYAVFYRETQDRRVVLLQTLDQRHGERQKRLQQDIAGLTDSLENAGFFARIWRGVTGRTRADRERMAEAQRSLEDIQRQRQSAHEAFERDRQQKLETLKAQEILRERERREAVVREQARSLPQAVNAPTARAGPALAEARTAQPQSPTQSETAPEDSYEARRRAFFQRLGAPKKAEREREEQPTQAPAQQSSTTPESNYEARRRAFFQRLGAQKKAEREREEEPTQGSARKVVHAFDKARTRRVDGGKEFTEAAATTTGMDEDALKRAREARDEGAHVAPSFAEAAQTGQPPMSRDEERRAAFMRRIRGKGEREQERDDGPTRERE